MNSELPSATLLIIHSHAFWFHNCLLDCCCLYRCFHSSVSSGDLGGMWDDNLEVERDVVRLQLYAHFHRRKHLQRLWNSACVPFASFILIVISLFRVVVVVGR